MPNLMNNLIVLLGLWGLMLASGIYVTWFEQPEQLEALEQAEKVERMQLAEVTALLAEEATSKQMAEEAVRKWEARYKIIPDTLSTGQALSYINALSARGFEQFDVTFSGVQASPDVSYYKFFVQGACSFERLYKLIWDLENRRSFYRIRNLKLDGLSLVKRDRWSEKERLKQLVTFTFMIEAYFGGTDGLSAPEALVVHLNDDDGAIITNADAPPPVPMHILPEPQPRDNPFAPTILAELPPNTNDLLEVDKVELVSIVGDRAVFKHEAEYHALEVGDRVYLGQVQRIEPRKGRVHIRLNKGGLVEDLTFDLAGDPGYRQALGPIRLAPVQ